MARHYVSNRVPSTPRELADALSDPQSMREVLGEQASPQAWEEFRDRFCENMNRGGYLNRLIDEAAQVEAAKMLKSGRQGGAPQLPVGEAGPRAGRRGKMYNKRAPGAAIDRLFAKSGPDTLLGDYMQMIDYRRPPNDTRVALSNALSERVPSGGGFLVPEVLRSDILQMVLEASVVRRRAHMVPMDSLRVPFPTIDETSHVSSVFGGITAFWTEEAAQLTISQPSFGRTVLEAKKLTAYTEVPNELLQDAVALTDWMVSQLPAAIAWYEDLAFISGTGTGQPQGFLNSPCAVVTGGGAAGARAGGAGAAVQFSDIVAMYARLLPMSMKSAVWLCSPDVLPGLLQMAVTSQGGTSGTTLTTVAPPIWLSGFSAADGYPGGGNGDGRTYEILGRPLVVTEKMPALNAQGCLALADFGFYLLGDRMEVTASSSEHYKFANDLTAFRWIERVDGRGWLQTPLTLEDGSANTLSPFVLLHS